MHRSGYFGVVSAFLDRVFTAGQFRRLKPVFQPEFRDFRGAAERSDGCEL
jgi:hypothetical protein